MTSIHAAAVHINGTPTAFPGWAVFGLVAGPVVLGHLVRAARVDARAAERWMRHRNLPQEPRAVLEVTAYLRRLRWSRVASAVLLVAVGGLALLAGNTWVSFVSLPFLLSVLTAEALAPSPRRGRVRVASLAPRARGFFAPRLALAAARVAIALGAGLSLGAGALRDTPSDGAAVLHGLVMTAGLVALEASLRQTACRALPDRQPDAQVDTALRVASSRTATAAGLVFGIFGLFLAISFAGAADALSGTGAMQLLNKTMTLSTVAAVAAAAWLVQPLGSWQPPSRR